MVGLSVETLRSSSRSRAWTGMFRVRANSAQATAVLDAQEWFHGVETETRLLTW
jgi:hypothetical protein